MKVLVATKNAGKIEGARKALSHYYKDFEISGIPVSSDVSDEPVNGDIYIGAKNRIQNLKKYAEENNIKADLYMSIESGIQDLLGKWMITNIAIVDDNEIESCATSPSFPVPEKYVKDIIEKDLGHVMDEVFFEDADRHNKGGGIQLLTHDVVSRIDLTESAFIMALTKYTNGDTWR